MTAKDAKAVRGKIVSYCEWGIANSGRIHYAQTRPIPVAAPKKLPLVTDCSGFATLAYKWAGAPDPNGNKYSGAGWTGSLAANGKRVTVPQPGDLIIYGDAPTHHVVVYMYEWHGAWVVCSHGQEIGPLRVLQHREEVAQPAPRRIYSYLPRA